MSGILIPKISKHQNLKGSGGGLPFGEFPPHDKPWKCTGHPSPHIAGEHFQPVLHMRQPIQRDDVSTVTKTER